MPNFDVRLKEFYVFIPVLVAFAALGILYPFLAIGIIKFLLFQLSFLLLPGYIFSKWLVSEKLTRIQGCIFGYPVSMVLIFILSWIGKLLNIRNLEAAILLFSVTALYLIIRKDRNEAQDDTSVYAGLCMLIYSVCIFIVFRIFILPSSPPTPAHPGLYYQDSLWSIGNTWSYIRGLPLEDARFSGMLFGYHILQNIYQATVFNFTKIDPFYVHFYIEPIFGWLIMVLLVFYGGIKIAKLSLRETAIFSICLFFTLSFLHYGFQLVLFIDPLTFFFGLPVFILFIFHILAYINNVRELDVIYLTVLFVYFTASKAILGLIVPIVLMVIFAIKLFKGDLSWREVLLVCGLFLGAVLLRFTMFQNTMHKITHPYDPEISGAYQLFKRMPLMQDYVGVVYPFYRFFSNFFRLLPNYIVNYSVLVFFALLFINREFRKKIKDIKGALIFMAVFFLVSIIMGSILEGSGREYYIYYPQVIFLFLGVLATEYILKMKNINYKIFAFLLLVLSIINLACGLANWVKLGWGGLPNAKRNIWDERATVNYDEYIAMRWLQENTGLYEVFFTDRRYFTHEPSNNNSRYDVPRFYGYTALSGRRAFAEGEGGFEQLRSEDKPLAVIARWDLINNFLFSDDSSKQENLLRQIKADYFIQSLRFNKKDFSKINAFKLVYENQSIKIFRILK